MLKLHSLDNTELSDYCLSILAKHGILLVREFISEKPEKLMKILNLNFEQIKKIKKEFRRLYGPKPFTIVERTKDEEVKKRKYYGTHIQSLDKMLHPWELFNNLSFWEICGPTGVGKTQLALTIMLNFVINQVSPALYIDTKLDFSAGRVKSMLKARKIKPDLYAGIMSFIKVERVLSAQGIVEMLEEFYKHLQQGNDNVSSIKMIAIDSLPAVWFLLKAESNRLSGKWLLSRLNQIINRLVQEHFIAVICVNLSLVPSQEENEAKSMVSPNSHMDNDIFDIIEADDMELDAVKSTYLASSYRPVLGHFWLSKPYVRLSVEYPEENDVDYQQDRSLRVIKLLKTRFCTNDLSCSVRLRTEGFVD